jgi:alanyl-tRNA synthetase
MTSEEIRARFLDFFKKKDHAIVPSSSLISDDPSVLFTTAGMQQFKSYYLGEKSPYGKNAASVQKCFRTSDIDSVGDESHLTFFEMLGNFSFGGYFKEKAIEYAYEFITKELKLKIDFVSVFGGNSENDIPADEESEKIWQRVAPGIEIKKAGKKDNFWGPTGEEGPCGPTTEIYINGLEIWNIVFNEYYQDKNGNFTKLKTPGVDTGMGLERLAMMVQDKPTIFETDLFEPISKRIYPELPERTKRIIVDHIRGIVFLISDGIRPSNKDAGYVLRRLLRRVITYAYRENIGEPPENLLQTAVAEYEQFYTLDKKSIKAVYDEEYQKFIKTIATAEKELSKIIERYAGEKDYASLAQKVFDLYQSQGLPIEAVLDEFDEKGLKIDIFEFRRAFDKEFAKHQEISRAGLEKKFGGHGLKEGGEITGVSEEEKQKIVRLHTATHLLHQALFDLFGDKIKQMGSDINAERFRFDFPLERKLTDEELKKLETTVNQKIEEALPVRFEEKTKEEAMAEGAKSFFKVKYPEKVKVYYINNYSKEICNGPHVKNTSEIGRFKILKEESVGAGVRRIKATVE